MAAVLLINPKYGHNVGMALRNCACYGIDHLRWTGNRIERDVNSRGRRLPREERLRAYQTVDWQKTDRPFDEFPDLVPVAIEVRENAEMLPAFEHPANALYVFGPEDGSLTNVTLRHCHRFVAIPTRHCLNLAVTVATVLYDRQVKLDPAARLDVAATEGRGWHPEDEHA